MRLLIVEMCGLVAAGVFATMFLAIWSTRRTPSNPTAAFKQGFATELVWTAIPLLMVLAAVIPAVVAIASTRTGD
jgi:cytochrome c oxidase subunit 2